PPVARAGAHHLRRPSTVPRHLLRALPRPVLHRRRLHARRGRLLLDHRPRRRRAQRLRSSSRHRRDRERAGGPPAGRRSRGGRVPARHQGDRHLRLRDLQAGGGVVGRRGAGGRAQGAGAPRDRADRHARPDSSDPRVAEDALGQDHAPHPAQDRRRRVRGAGRHHHAGRACRGGAVGRRPPRGRAGLSEALAAGASAAASTPAAASATTRSRERLARVRFYWVVAVCGAVIMALEILASRVLAPAFGNSVYVWGSIISVFLAALAAGYRLGGRLADREPSLAALGRLVLLAALSQALLLFAGAPLVAALGRWTGGSPGGTLVATTLLFGPASLLLATVSPYAIRLAARDLAALGDTAGRLFALSTAGSLVGTLGCTFVLIPLLQLQPLLALLVGVTTLTALVAIVGSARREAWSYALAATLLAATAVKGVRPPPLPPLTLYSGITPYQSLAVGDVDDRRFLTSNSMLHSAVMRDTGEPGLAYSRSVALTALFAPHMRRALMLGMGSGSVGIYLQRRIDGLEVD